MFTVSRLKTIHISTVLLVFLGLLESDCMADSVSEIFKLLCV